MHSPSDAPPGTLRRALPALLLGLLLVVAFRGMLQGRLFYLRDVSQNHYPVRAFITERLHALDLPLWDPLHGGGTPLLANPNALVLHPITLLFFVLPFDAAFVASIVLQFALLAAGGYLLGRSLRLGREASLLVAAVLILSGPAASLASMQNVLSAAAWVPIALWALLRGSVAGRRVRLAPAALCAAVVLIAAEPASLLALVLLGGALAATEPTTAPRRRLNVAACAAFGAVLAAAALVAAAEILPARALLPLTERGAGFDASEGLKWSLLPQRLPELFLPGLFGDPTRLSPSSWWGGFLFEGRYPFLLSVYLGLLPCVLAFIGALHRGAATVRRRALGAIAVLSLLLALGRNSVVYRSLFGALDPLRQVRYPERFVLVFLFATALLAGYGIERLIASPPSRRATLGIAAVSASAFAFCACAATARFADGFLARLAHVPGSFLVDEGGTTLRASLLRSTLWAFGESVLLAVLVVHLRRRPPASQVRLAALAIVLIGSVSMMAASSPARSMAAAGWLTAPSPLRGLVGHGAGGARLHHARRPPDLSVRGATDELVWGYRYDRFVYALMTGHTDSVPTALDAATDRMDLKDSPDLGHSLETLPLDRQVRVLAACRVGYLLSYDPLDDPALLAGPVLDGLSRPAARLYQVRDVVPRLRFVTHARPLRETVDLASALSDPGYDPGRAVLLDEAAGGAPVEGAGDGGTNGSGGEVVITHETPERIGIRVTSRGPGYVVLADAYAPGWRATLDTQPVPILRADGLFRAVKVPGGEHSVEMVYRPAEVVAGLLLGVLGVVLVTAYGVAARCRAW